jgi:hypothetical protein
VQREVARWFDRRRVDQHRVLSVCAGQGRDLLEVMADRADVDDVSAVLVELDPVNAAAARRLAGSVRCGRIEVVQQDAGQLATYQGWARADLVLICGVFGNISDEDVRRTITSLPTLCAQGATVVWTRHRSPPDLTPAIRRWFDGEGFVEETFIAPADANWSVGVHVFGGENRLLDRDAEMFRFAAEL